MTREGWDPPVPERTAGPVAFAGILLILVGAWQVFIGYAVAGGETFVFSGSGYWYRADNAGWGWVNLFIGLIAVACGMALAGWPRRFGPLRAKTMLALGVAVVSAMNQFFLAPQYPLWATLVIAVDVFIIWAVTTQTGADDAGTETDRISR
ncbi:DUF7144 family membrane protein [Glycomyces buryatensis]|uniref:DUF7144 domain-containing protein n=1 Tax=Glycomyces buryatensis TaxID=2570927 RepID=A0A4S8QAV3_9ACTN|nr:hypothetical protein [Glycomyces buryatensis]THV41607.1 hypothetical protein FAB82_10930 [Glycomyces buryatensis]